MPSQWPQPSPFPFWCTAAAQVTGGQVSANNLVHSPIQFTLDCFMAWTHVVKVTQAHRNIESCLILSYSINPSSSALSSLTDNRSVGHSHLHLERHEVRSEVFCMQSRYSVTELSPFSWNFSLLMEAKRTQRYIMCLPPFSCVLEKAYPKRNIKHRSKCKWINMIGHWKY